MSWESKVRTDQILNGTYGNNMSDEELFHLQLEHERECDRNAIEKERRQLIRDGFDPDEKWY